MLRRLLAFLGRVALVTVIVALLRMACFMATGRTFDALAESSFRTRSPRPFDYPAWAWDEWAEGGILGERTTTLGSLLFWGHRKSMRAVDAATGAAVWVLASCLVYELLWGARALPDDGESRCRRCSYILRGLSAPRCPECGEAV
jgi:hypothetical protein